MQNKRFSARLISLLLTLSFLVSAFSIFAFAAESNETDDTGSVNVVYNRTFEEGWGYDNGLSDSYSVGNKVGMSYEFTDYGYNYYLKLEKLNTAVSYMLLDTEGKLPSTGKTFIEMDIASKLGNAMGQAVRVNVHGSIKTLVEFKADGMYVLGTNIGSAAHAMKWESLAFEFDFDYAADTLGAASDEYRVAAYNDGKLVAEQIWRCSADGFGITQLRFSYGNVLAESIGSWYAIDNLRVYSGVDNFTILDGDNYGSAVDATAAKDFTLADDATDPDGYLRGEPTVDRNDDLSNVVNYYNRHFGEGWTLNNASSLTGALIMQAMGNNLDIKSETTVAGKTNHFVRYRALNNLNGYLEIPLNDAATEGELVIELDLKAGVMADLGGVLQLRDGAGNSQYALSIVDGQLLVLGAPVGYVGSDWVHIILQISYSKDGTSVTVYYGARGVGKGELTVSAVTAVRIGAEGDIAYDSFGDWFGLDNLQIYSGATGFVTLPENDYGTSVDATADKDFNLHDITPDAPAVPEDVEEEEDKENNFDKNEYLSGSPDLERLEYASVSESLWLRYKRHYGEGWDFDVGGGSSNKAIMKLENEQSLNLTYNYYQYYEATQTGNVYWTLETGSGAPTDKLFIEMDIRAVEGCNLGGVFQMMQAGGSPNPDLFGFNDGNLWILDEKNVVGKITENDWVHLAFEFDFTYALTHPEVGEANYRIACHFGENRYFEVIQKRGGSKFGIARFRIGFYSPPRASIGQFWHMDNLAVYGGTDTFVDIPEDVFGATINGSEPKDFPIQTTAVSLDTMIEESLFMKVGSDYTLLNNKRTPALEDAETGKALGRPIKDGDNVWVPIDVILNFLDYPKYIHEDNLSLDISTGTSITYITLGRNTAVVAGEKVTLKEAPAMLNGLLVVTVEDLKLLFPEFYIKLDDMNMIIFTKYEQLVQDLSELVRIDLLKDFIFNYIAADQVYDMVKENTNNFDHPYLIVNQARFDELRETWLAGRRAIETGDPTIEYDKVLYSYISSSVNQGRSAYNKYSAVSMGVIDDGYGTYSTEGYSGLRAECYVFDNETNSIGLQHSYLETNGYDPIGGRLYPPYDGLRNLAYAYQITRDDRFAFLAYDWATELADWHHWGPGHFLNCADTASPMGITYDWCYDAWVRLGLDVDRIADGIFYHGALQGYLVTIGQPDPHGRRGGSGDNYTAMVNNWNTVCTAGVAAAALSIMDYDGFDITTKIAAPTAIGAAEKYGTSKMRGVLTHVVASNFKSLVNVGLDIYAPDGSYEESVSYWSYGAGSLFLYSQLLESALGTDLGLMDTWGIDRTCYSILHMVSSDFVVFAYNDGSVGGSMSSGYFAYVAYRIGDPALALIRRMHMEKQSLAASQNDSFFYQEIEDGNIELPLQYHHIGIHGYTIRSSWESGAIYAGLLGGDNDDGHGHIDAGQWIYYNKGIRFIEDIGPDEYNTLNYFSNNHMYKTTTEGHNVICVTSYQDKLPAGQERHSVSPITEVYDNEYGGYAITDTTPAFNGALTYAYRGILMTNDRKTVIIQDEISPSGAQEIYWFAHYNISQVTDVEISSDGRTAYMTSHKSNLTAKEEVLRITIVSPLRRGIQFQLMDTYTFTLDKTMRPGDSEAAGKQPESDRSSYNKLAINLKDLPQFEFAVVLEVIDEKNPVDVGYTWTPMADWEPKADTRDINNDVVVEDVLVRTNTNPSEVRGGAVRIEALLEYGTQFEQLEEFYSALTGMTYVINDRGMAQLSANKNLLPYLEVYSEYLNLYNTYIKDVQKTTDHISLITGQLIGAKTKSAEDNAAAK